MNEMVPDGSSQANFQTDFLENSMCIFVISKNDIVVEQKHEHVVFRGTNLCEAARCPTKTAKTTTSDISNRSLIKSHQI